MGKQQSKVTESHIIGWEENLNESAENGVRFNSIPECLSYHAREKPENDALVFYSTAVPRSVVSFKELFDRSSKIASAFEEMGLQAGETVVLVSRSCPEWYYCAIGAMMVRARIISVNLTYTDGSDILTLMKKLENCSLLVLDPGHLDSNWKIIESLIDDIDDHGRVSSPRMPYLRNLVFLHETLDPKRTSPTVAEFICNNKPGGFKDTNLKDIAVLFQTSGSTGDPKIVAYTHESLLKPTYLYRYTGIEGGINLFNDRPFFWISAFMWDTLKGYTRTSISGLCPEPRDYTGFVMHVIHSEKCNVAIMIPPTIYELVKRENDLPVDWPLKTIATGSQPITKSLSSCVGRLCKQLCVMYGGSEFNTASGLIVEDRNNFVDYACGRPPGGCELKIVDENGEVVPVGQRGEIYLKTKWAFEEYHNDPEKTKAAITEDGWYKTDDQGRINSDGILFVEGRKSEIIVSGGKKVAPFILEAVLKAHPDIDEAVIVPVPDEELYQAICACVKLKNKSDITEARLQEYTIQTYTEKADLFTALPNHYMILDKIPRERTGKISRKSLKTMAAEKFCNENE